jgi:hypothetical protein
MFGAIEKSEDGGQEGFWFGPHFIRLVRNFTTEAGTVEDIGFVATDLAKALDMRDAANAIRGLDPDQKGTHQVSTPGGLQSLTVISESGFYDVVVRSDKPQGKALRHLVTREILPQLRTPGTAQRAQLDCEPSEQALPAGMPGRKGAGQIRTLGTAQALLAGTAAGQKGGHRMSTPATPPSVDAAAAGLAAAFKGQVIENYAAPEV